MTLGNRKETSVIPGHRHFRGSNWNQVDPEL